jgi:hypothetical protein
LQPGRCQNLGTMRSDMSGGQLWERFDPLLMIQEPFPARSVP